jgi:hypothetical protein
MQLPAYKRPWLIDEHNNLYAKDGTSIPIDLNATTYKDNRELGLFLIKAVSG